MGKYYIKVTSNALSQRKDQVNITHCCRIMRYGVNAWKYSAWRKKSVFPEKTNKRSKKIPRILLARAFYQNPNDYNWISFCVYFAVG